jgi:hypothetical protein
METSEITEPKYPEPESTEPENTELESTEPESTALERVNLNVLSKPSGNLELHGC